MRLNNFALFAICVIWPSLVGAQTPTEIEQSVNTMVRLCLAGGERFAVGGGGSGGADVSLRSFDVKGKLTGEFKVEKSKVEGLVEGINNAMSQVAADQADKVRTCLQPLRERLLDIMLPPKPKQVVPNADRSGKSNSDIQLKAIGRSVRPDGAGGAGSNRSGYAARILLQNVSGGTLFVAAEGLGRISIGNCVGQLSPDSVSGLAVGYDLSKVMGNGLVGMREALQMFPVDAQIVATVRIQACELADQKRTDVSFPVILSRDQQALSKYNISIIDMPIER